MRNSTLLKSRVASTCYRLLVIILLSIPIGLLSQNVNKSKVKAITKSFSKSQKTANEDGTIANPFTNVDQITATTPNGLYYFDLGGNQFQTKVETGWVLVANDVGTPVSQSLQDVTSLSPTVRGILSSATLANLGNINVIKVKASNGLLDVTSTNATLVSRVKLGQTLHAGTVDNAINDSWTGVGAVDVIGDATCNTNRGSNLKDNIFHTCGNVNGIVWIPSVGERMIRYNDDNVADNVSFGLWVKQIDPPTITSLSSLTGCIGGNLVINGTNLLETQAVTIGGTAVTIVSTTPTSVTVNTEFASGLVKVTTVIGEVTSTDAFSIAPNIAESIGSGCNPFTSIEQVTANTPNGMYYFNLNGNLFKTKVQGGWVLVINDAGDLVSSNLNEVINLDETTRGIVSAGALANLGNIDRINIKSSDAVLDVISTNTTIIDRIKQGKTIHEGQTDNAINDSWTGSSEANMKLDATCPSTAGSLANVSILDPCGAATGTTWIPSQGVRRINYASGNVASTVSFGLWVQKNTPPTITSLSATSGSCNTVLTINGTFLANTTAVTIGGTTVTIVSTSPTTVVVNTGFASGEVQVTTPGNVVTAATAFTFIPNTAEPLGSGCNPFTSIEQVTANTPNGMYYFNLNGNLFKTKVEGGWVLVLNDAGALMSSNLNEAINLDETTRGVLSAGTLAALGNIDRVNIKSSDGMLDVISTNTTILDRIKQSQTIHKGQADNSINDSWVGASESNIKIDASCPTNSGSLLKENVLHPCGASTATLWIPSLGFRRINNVNGDVASTVSFGLWVQKNTPPTITSLSATSGSCNTVLSITGTFLANTTAVTIGGIAVTIVSTSPTSVVVNTGFASGAVQVTTPGNVVTATDAFTQLPNLAEPLGSGCNPFTNISQVTSNTADGNYYFRLNGNLVETKVQAGWVLVANDTGASVSQELTEVAVLDSNVRGILNNGILSNLGNFNVINLTSSNGALNATTNNTTLIDRLKQSVTLHQGVNDNALNDSWFGTLATNLTTNATCTSGDGSALKSSIIHICGPSNTINWVPKRGVREYTDASGFVGSTVGFGLWVTQKPQATITSLSKLMGCPTSTLVINGTNLLTVQSVTIGGVPVRITAITDIALTVTVGLNSGAVVVTTSLGTVTASDSFTITFNTSDPLGSVCNPFTSIEEVTGNTANGMYYFNLNGNLFETKVQGGWVLVLNDAGAFVSSNLNEVINLDVTTRGIVSAGALAALGSIDRVNIKSSDGVLDVISTNTTILDRIKQSQTLHQGVNDNVINDSWVGSSSANMQDNAFCTTGFGTSLSSNIIHTCGSPIGSTWIPSQGVRRVQDGSGNVAASVSFGLWVQKNTPPTITSLSATSGSCNTVLTIAGTFLANTTAVTIGGTAVNIVSTSPTTVVINTGFASGTVQVTTPGNVVTATDAFTQLPTVTEPLGSGCNPFTSIAQVTSSITDGNYYFRLNDNLFQSKVQKGWVLVANDIGGSSSQDLQETSTLTESVRGILNSTILSNLGNFSVINIKSSNAVLNARSTDATLIDRLKQSITLHQGVNDNTLNDSWFGTLAGNLTTDATCPSQDGTVLKGNIVHICGLSNSLNWIPRRGIRELTDATGFVGATVGFGLWVKQAPAPIINSLSSVTGCIGSSLTINGSDFTDLQSVTIGGVPVTVVSSTETSITVTISAGASGAVKVETDGGIATAADAFTITFDTNQPLGTGCNPFTSLDQITISTTDGTYTFNLNGTLFETKIEGGWVLIANDSGTPVSQNLNEVLALDVTTRGILNTTILSNLGNLDGVKVKSSNGLLNATSVDPNLKLRVKQGATLHQGVNDNSINDTWVGASANALTVDAISQTTYSTALKANIIHLSGNAAGTHWLPSQGERRITYSGGNVADNVSFGLWVKPSVPIVYEGIAGSNLWLKADAGISNTGANLTAWVDQAGINSFTKQGSIGYTTNTINFNPSVVFTNPENETNLPVNRLDGNSTINYVDGFAVYKSNRIKSCLVGGLVPGVNYGQGIFLSYGSSKVVGVGMGTNSAHSQFTNLNLSAYNIANLDVSLTTSPFATGRLNGLSQTVNHSGGPAFPNLEIKPMIGGTNNKGVPGGWFAFEGEVAEVMLFPYSLTATDKAKAESYLALKYGITLDNSVTDYVNSAGTSIWNSTAYWYDVFGIGKDATLGLNQPQSNSINTGSGDGTGQSGKGNIVLSNPSSLDDGDFLMIGHNNGGFTEQITDLPSSLTGKKRIAREWKVQQSGSVGAVSLTFNTLGLALTGTNASDYSLLIDNDGDGDFSTGSVTEVTAISLVGDIAIFSNATLSNNAVFTFATGNIPTTLDNALANVTLYPNPTKGNIQINLGQFASQTIITVFDVTGSKVSEDTFSSTNIIHLNILGGSGIYFIELNVEGLKHKFKVVKL